MSEAKKVIVNGQEYRIFDQNITSDEIAFSAFSGYMAFSGQLAEEVLKRFGDAGAQLIGKKVNLVFAVSSGVIEGVFDINMNQDKELTQVVTEAAVEAVAVFASAETGAFVLSPLGPVASVVGAVTGAVLGAVISSINVDDWYKGLNDWYRGLFVHTTVTAVGDDFSFEDDNIEGKVTSKELYIKESAQISCIKELYPKVSPYRQITTIEQSLKDILLSYDKNNQTATIKTSDEQTQKELLNLIFENNKEVKRVIINSKEYNVTKDNNLTPIKTLKDFEGKSEKEIIEDNSISLQDLVEAEIGYKAMNDKEAHTEFKQKYEKFNKQKDKEEQDKRDKDKKDKDDDGNLDRQ